MNEHLLISIDNKIGEFENRIDKLERESDSQNLNIMDIKQYHRQLRIEFAKAALTGLLAHSGERAYSNNQHEIMAQQAFELADAMIERMNK
jgi:hypothetical protein